MKFLNLGCGDRYIPDWDNFDFATHSEHVVSHNLLTDFPIKDSSYDLVYHSHLLEHFSSHYAPIFLRECFRVLRPYGILRVAVPDLESIASNYLIALEKVCDNSSGWASNYQWMQIELLDQLVRNQSGGLMRSYLSQEHIPNPDFIVQRLGSEAKKLIEREKKQSIDQAKKSVGEFSTTFKILESITKPIYRFFRYPDYRRNAFLRLILNSKEYQALDIGRFRQMGEVHQWMYDSYSLAKLIKQCGFTDVLQRTATTSYLENWSSYNLDTEPDGSVYKPDSLFIEAIKPEL